MTCITYFVITVLKLCIFHNFIVIISSLYYFRFVYSQVQGEDPEGMLDDQGPNKNFGMPHLFIIINLFSKFS